MLLSQAPRTTLCAAGRSDGRVARPLLGSAPPDSAVIATNPQSVLDMRQRNYLHPAIINTYRLFWTATTQ